MVNKGKPITKGSRTGMAQDSAIKSNQGSKPAPKPSGGASRGSGNKPAGGRK
jgi:hypothetical protein